MGVERVIVAPGNTAVTPLDFISYPITHSLLASLGWACLFAGIYKIVKHDSRGAVCLWFVVLSHWVLDALSHRPDLPLYPGSSTYVGLGTLEFADSDDLCGERDLLIRRVSLCKSDAGPRPHRFTCLPVIPRSAFAREILVHEVTGTSHFTGFEADPSGMIAVETGRRDSAGGQRRGANRGQLPVPAIEGHQPIGTSDPEPPIWALKKRSNTNGSALLRRPGPVQNLAELNIRLEGPGRDGKCERRLERSRRK